MADREKDSKVLLIIDVQKPFLSEKTQGAVNYIQELLRQGRFRCVVQTFWRNYPGSRYETQLGYRLGMETQPWLHCPDAKMLIRSTYSAVSKELLRLIRKEDEIYVTGLETDACVLATLFDLWDNGFSFRVCRKGVATNREDLAGPTLALIRRQFGEQAIYE